jgi:hypothetical protein
MEMNILKKKTIHGKRAFFPNQHNIEILNYNLYHHVVPKKVQRPKTQTN